MRWPIAISIYSHEMIVNQLTSQVSDLKRERELLLDRLATIGLGGPLFNLPQQQDSSASTAEGGGSISAEEEEAAYMRGLMRTPSKYADYVTRKAFRDANRVERPSVARIPDARMTAMITQAENEGKKQA